MSWSLSNKINHEKPQKPKVVLSLCYPMKNSFFYFLWCFKNVEEVKIILLRTICSLNNLYHHYLKYSRGFLDVQDQFKSDPVKNKHSWRLRKKIKNHKHDDVQLRGRTKRISGVQLQDLTGFPSFNRSFNINFLEITPDMNWDGLRELDVTQFRVTEGKNHNYYYEVRSWVQAAADDGPIRPHH